MTESATSVLQELPREQLRGIVHTYGLAICGEPQRCEALLRDLCPGNRREVFLLTAALRENVVSELRSSRSVVPEDLLISKAASRLSAELGLEAHSATWAVEAWLRAIEDAPLESIRPPEPAFETPIQDLRPRRSKWHWAWMLSCVLAALNAIGSMAAAAWAAYYHETASIQSWSIQTAIFSAILGVLMAEQFWLARRFSRLRPPDPGALDPARVPFALLLEVIVLLTLPLAPIVIFSLWAAEWIWELHLQGQPHDMAFHLGRIIQSLILAGFLWKWIEWMTAIQGRIAKSLVRQR